MIESLKAFLDINTLAEHIFFYGTLIIAGLGAAIGIIYAFIYISGYCFEIEEETKKEAHTFIKSGMIAIAPTIYGIVISIEESLIYEIPYLQKILIFSFAALFVSVLIWNLNVYGLKGILFTISHTGFGFVGAAAFIFMLDIAIIAGLFWLLSFFFGGGAPAGGGGKNGPVNGSYSSSASVSIPSFVIDTKTNKFYYVKKEANNEYYVLRDGKYIPIRKGDYPNSFIDNNNNRYVK